MIAKSRSHARSLAVLFALLIAALLVARPARAQEVTELWKPGNLQTVITGPLRVNLAYTDKAGKELIASAAQLTAAQLDGFPQFLANAKSSPLLRAGYFDQMWSAIKGQVCQDVQASVQRIVNRSPNTAYDIQPCVMDPHAYLVVTFQTGWQNDNFQQVSGRRIIMNLTVPFNGVMFWVTSPHTCHHGGPCNPGQPEDPLFVLAFTANIVFTCAPFPTATVPNFNLPISCQMMNSINMDGLYGGDVTGQLQQAAGQFAGTVLVQAAGAAATGGASLPEAAGAIALSGLKTLIDGIGAGIALLDDQHLRDAVSDWLSMGGVGSPTLSANANTANTELNQLFTNLYNAWLGGLRPFAIAVGVPQLSLDFGLVYPPPAKPLLKNAIAAQNAGSIIAPSIAIAQPEVVAGQLLPVKASSFTGTYSTTIPLSWNKTVFGTAHSVVAYGPPPTEIQTTANTFNVTGLKPLSEYLFSVKECDGLSCSPSSDEVKVKTEAGGANEVIFWLDKDVKNPVGTFPAPTTGGNFTANVRIPPATTPGQHELYASIYGRPPASAAITVCQPSGCKPSVGVVNPANGTIFPANSVVVVGAPVILRGAAFAANGEVAIFLDNVKGTRLATAPVGPAGGFQATIKMPMVQAGHHTLVVLEARPGTAPPHIQWVEASVPVFVQAMAQ